LHSPYSGQVRKLACPVWAGWLKIKKGQKVEQTRINSNKGRRWKKKSSGT